MLIIALTSCTTVSQLIFPEVLELLRRNPLALRHSEWWRAVTPLLVHSGGLVQFLANIAGIAVVGTFLETKIGAWRMLFIYLAGGVAGEVGDTGKDGDHSPVEPDIAAPVGCGHVDCLFLFEMGEFISSRRFLPVAVMSSKQEGDSH